MKKFDKNLVSVSFFALSFFIMAGPVFAFAAGPEKINLGTAGNFVILSKTGVSNTGTTSVVGDIGISPAAASYITGFALNLPSASPFSTSAIVIGKIYAPGYADPTPANMSTAISDMQTAYTDGSGRTNPTATELGAGNIGGMTLAPGLYKWGTGVTIPTDVTLSGGANDVWIFQIAQNLDISSAKKIVLAGGAQAGNIFWIVAGQTTISTGALFNGNILDQTAIVLNTGAILNGRALAQTAVTLDANSVIAPTLMAVVTPSIPVVPEISNTPTNPTTPIVPATPNTSTSGNSSNVTDREMLIAQITEQIKTIQNQINQQNFSTPTPTFGQQIKMIVVNLGEGNKNDDVATLQQFLISQNRGSAAQALARVGVTSYFGMLTRAALAEFQASVGISPALGNFGPITRNYVSIHY